MKPVDPRLLRYAGAARGFLAASALIGVVQTAVTIAFAWLLTDAITGAIAGRDVASSLVWLLLTVLLRGLLIAASDAAGTRAAARTGVQLRAALIAAVGRLGPGWLVQRNQTTLAVTAGHGLEALDAYFARYIPQLVLTVIATPVLVAVMWWQDWPSGLTAIITLPLIPIFLILIGMATRTVQQKQWQTLQRLAARFADTVQGLSTLRLFGRDRRAADRIETTADEYRRETMKVLRFSFLSGFAMELLASIAVALIAVSVGFRLLSGDLTLEVGLFVLLLAPEAFLPIRQVGVQFHAASEGVAATEDVFAVLDAARADGSGVHNSSKTSDADLAGGTSGPSRAVLEELRTAGAGDLNGAGVHNSGELRGFDAVSPDSGAVSTVSPDLRTAGSGGDRGFRMDRMSDDGTDAGRHAADGSDIRDTALQGVRRDRDGRDRDGQDGRGEGDGGGRGGRDGRALVVAGLRVRELPSVSFRAEPGTVTLIEGPSGSGKSSLLAALRGATDFAGTAHWAGQDLRGLAPSAWLAWAGQAPGLMRGTVADNVALGDSAPDTERVRTALVAACAEGIAPDRVLGVQGSGLSGGQAQRIAVARALYRHAAEPERVLALDEPSSALDPDTEERLWRSLRERADAGATILLVSHRRSAREIADHIVALGVSV